MSILDDNIIDATDIESLSGQGFPRNKEELLSHYPSGYRSVARDLSGQPITKKIPIIYHNQYWFDFGSRDTNYVVGGVEINVFYKNHVVNQKTFPIGWTLEILPIIEERSGIEYKDVAEYIIRYTNMRDFIYNTSSNYLKRKYQVFFDTYNDAIHGAFEILDFLRYHPGSVTDIITRSMGCLAIGEDNRFIWKSNQEMFDCLLNF